MIVNGLPGQGMGGGVLIGAKSSPYFSTQHTESNTILDAFGGDGKRMWLGMIQYWNQYNELPTPLLKMTELQGQVLETPGFGAYLDWVLPYKLRKPFVKANIVDTTVQRPGYGGSLVPLVLSDKFAQGDTLTNDKRNGVQVRVSDTHPIESLGAGNGYVHQVSIASNDPEDYIPWEVLEPGVSWFKIDNRSGEFGLHSSSLTNQGMGLIQQSYKTANSELSISHSITSYADQFNVESLSKSAVYPGLFNYKNMTPADQDAIMNFYNIGPDGKPVKGTNTWMPSIINKMIVELAMMKEYSLTWAKGFTFTGEGGAKVDVPTGYYHQVKERGVYFQYSDLTNIIGVLKSMVAQLFAGRKGLKIQDRRIKFTMGLGAFQEAQKAFGEYARATNPFQIVNVGGNNPVTNGIFTGDFQNLTYRQPRVVSVEFPEIGLVEIEHNAALDYLDDDNEFQHYTGLLPNSSYIIWVEDLTADEFSNAIPKNAQYNVPAGAAKISANVVQLKPMGYEDTISFIPGRGYNPTLNRFIGQSAKSQIATNKQKGFEVIMDTCGEIFIKDPSRIVLGEYVPKNVHLF
jgi:hypothetical protein